MNSLSPLYMTAFLGVFAVYLSLSDRAEVVAKLAPEVTPETPATWPHEISDIPADPKASFGQLENGLRYVILPNTEPPKRLSIRLHIAAGSLMEREDQKGLAHFLEHMVFNGTRSYTDANALVREMQNRGIAFGADVNAYTSFDETVYMFDLPDLNSDTMDLTFGVMRDFADGALLSQAEVDAERGVILAEKTSRDSVDFRMMQKQFQALLHGSVIADRFPIGTDDFIKTANRDTFVEFYKNFYTPDRMTLVAVGDIDPKELEKRIKDTFASIQPPESVKPAPEIGEVQLPSDLVSHVFTDPELSSTDVSLTLIRPYSQKIDNFENRAKTLPLQLANSILDRRFVRISKQEGTAVKEGGASKYPIFNEIELGTLSITTTDEGWEAVVPVLEQELRRAREHGFTEAEFSEAKANLLNLYREATKSQNTRKSDKIATSMVRSINSKKVFTQPATDLAVAEEALEKITIEQLQEEFDRFWTCEGYHLVLSTKSAPASAKNKLKELFEESAKQTVTPPEERTKNSFAYNDFGAPGTIAKKMLIPDLNITQLQLSNNIRINLKQTDFEKNRILASARIGSGQLSQPAHTPFLDQFTEAIFADGGLGKHSNDELSEILAGRNVAVSLSVGEDSFLVAGSTTPGDQLLQLQLMVAQIMDPGYRPEALWQFQKNIPNLYQSIKHTPSGPMMEMQSWLHGADFRYSLPAEKNLSAYTIEQAKKWVKPELTTGYIELSIVGDFDQDLIIKDLLATFGTLPPRASSPSSETSQARYINFPIPPSEKSFQYQSKVAQGSATAIWKTDGIRGNIIEARRLNILAEIYGDRLREEIREKLSASYSPSAASTGSDALEGFGYLIGQATASPADIPALHQAMESIAQDLFDKGASQDELDRALKPTLTQLEKSARDNSYWLGSVLAQAQADPERVILARGRDADYRSITLEEINSLAKKYFLPSNHHKISIRSVE